MTKIGYLDGIRYVRAVVKGCQETVSHAKELNKINVFPIPDKDTGSNLKKTFQHICIDRMVPEASLRQSSRRIAEADTDRLLVWGEQVLTADRLEDVFR